MIRYIDRPVSDLVPGDRFSLTDENAMHTCVKVRSTAGYVDIADGSGVFPLPVTGPDQTVLVEVDIAYINVTLRLEVDTARWAREYGTETHSSAVYADVRRYFDPVGLVPEHLVREGIVGVKGTDIALDPVSKP
jgi:hypothetical protein